MFENKFNLYVSAKVRPDFRKALKNEEYPLKLYICFRRKSKCYSVKMAISRSDYKKLSNSKRIDQNLININKEIIKITAKANKIIKDIGNDFTFEIFESKMFNIKLEDVKDKYDVYACYEEKMRQLLKENRIGSYQAYMNSMMSLKSFRKTLRFKDVTVNFLKKYEYFMLAKECSKSTIGIQLRQLRAIMNIAKSSGLITEDEYPFGHHKHNKYEIPSSRNIKKAVEPYELKKIINYEPNGYQESWSRDMWLFSYYCNGMNMVDVFNLKYKNIVDEFLYYVREKTKNTCRNVNQIEIFLVPQVKKIINQWGSKNQNSKTYVFEVFDDTMSAMEKKDACKIGVDMINRTMRSIADKLEINKSVSTYVARHTWATILLRNNISMGYISKGLGHTSFTTTERYLADFDQDQKREIGKILTNIN